MGWYAQRNGLLTHTGSDFFWCAHVAIDTRARVVAAVATNYGDQGAMRPYLGRLLQEALVSARA